MLNRLLQFGKVLFALAAFLSIFHVILELTYFLSFPKLLPKALGDPWLSTSKALLTDMVLLTLFIIQHSGMASKKYKDLIDKFGLSDVSRSIYVAATSAVFYLILKHWQTSVQVQLWNLNLNSKPILYLYVGVHITAWTIIYVANICADLTELFGLKQIYYSLLNLPDPNLRKTHELRKLNSHMRHPSFLGLVLVFWFFPIMTLDRALLATILTFYMYVAWNTDGEDYHYQKYMCQRKHFELQRLNRSQ